MEEIEIQKTINGVGFVGKPEVKTLEAVKFKNGKIDHRDRQSILSLDSEAAIEDHPSLKIVKKDSDAVSQ